MKHSPALARSRRSKGSRLDADSSREMLRARLDQLKLADHFTGNTVLHARNFLDVSEAWNFESLHLWMAKICDYSNTRVLSRKAGERVSRRSPSAKTAFVDASKGRSLQIGDLNRVLGPSDPLMKLFFAIQDHLGVAVEEIGMFFSPPLSRAIARHIDKFDVLTVQLQGSKHWDIWIDADLKESRRAPPKFSIDLRPGSLLFVPAFAPHAVISDSEESLSVAFPLHPRGYRELVPELIYNLPGPSRLLNKTIPGRGDVRSAREQLGKLAAALVGISDRDLSSAIDAVRRASALGKTDVRR
jgi:hypothetical protein